VNYCEAEEDGYGDKAGVQVVRVEPDVGVGVY